MQSKNQLPDENQRKKVGSSLHVVGTPPSDRPENIDVIKQAVEAAYASRGHEWSSQFQQADTAERIRMLREGQGKDTPNIAVYDFEEWDKLYRVKA